MDPLFEKNLITTKDAGDLSGYTSDYLARLARSGKIVGTRIGHSWLIDKESLTHFLDQQGDRKIVRARSLARAREAEYRAHHSLLNPPNLIRTHKHIGHISMSDMSDTNLEKSSFSRDVSLREMRGLRGQVLALSVALLVVVSGALTARVAMVSELAARTVAIVEEVSSGFVDTFGDIPSRIVSRIEKTNSSMRAQTTNVAATNAITSANLASPMLADLDLSSVHMPLFENASTNSFATRQPGGATSRLPITSVAGTPITIENVQLFAHDAYAFATHPSFAARALVRAYVAIGHDAYTAIAASLSAYNALIKQSGVHTLALAATTRDTLASAPHLINRMNLAFGQGVIDTTHALIHADVATAYGLATAAPASARATVALIGGAGDALANSTARAVVETPARLALALRRLSEAGPRLAQAVFNAEYAGATRFVALTNRVTGGYFTSVTATGQLSYDLAVEVRLQQRLLKSDFDTVATTLARVPVAFEDAYLGALGKTASWIEVRLQSNSQLAAALAGLSGGERIALATYETIHNFLTSAGRALALLFAPPPTIVISGGAPPQPVTTIATSTRTTISYYPTYTTIVQGVSPDLLNQSLASLRTNIFANLENINDQIARNAASLTNLIVKNGDFRGGSLTNGVLVSATTGNFNSLTATYADFGSLSAGTTTIIGDLAVSGSITPGTVIAGNSVSAPYFSATSTTATSTFAGRLAIGTTTPWGDGFFTVGTTTPLLHISSNTGNIGIGTLASGYRLDLNGTLRAAGDAYFNSHVSLGDATSTDIIYFNSRIADSLVPTADNILDLGDGTNWLRWRTGYFGTSVGIGGTATSTGTNLLTSGAYLLDTGSALSINTTNNQPVSFGTGNVILPYASSTALTLASALWVGGNATTSSNGNFTTNGNLAVHGITNDIAGTLNLSGGTLTSTAALSVTSGGAGDLTFDSGSGSINIASGDDILAVGANSNIGSIGVKFNTLYADTISATTLIGVVSGGSTDAADWVINADNASDDTQPMTLAFERGTVTPNALLTWNANGNAKRFELNQPLFIQNASASTTITTLDLKSVAGQTADIFRVASSSGANLLNFSAAGNLGVGVASPTYALDVSGLGHFSGLVDAANLVATSSSIASVFNGGFLANASSTITSGLFTMSGGASTTAFTASGQANIASLAGAAVSSLTANYLPKWNSGTFMNSLVYDTGTNVGIGTSTPQWNLQVAGVRPSFALSDTSAGADLKHWLFSSMGGNLYIGTSTDAYATSTPAALTISNAGNATFAGTITATSFSFASPLAVGYGGTGVITLTGLLQGNGAGVVTGITGTAGQFPYYNGASTLLATSTIFLATSGNVGIGTTGPGAMLDVTNAANNGTDIREIIRLRNNNNNSGIAALSFSADATYYKAGIGFQRKDANGPGDLIFYVDSNADAANYAAGDEKMIIKQSGNVGIGTTTPGNFTGLGFTGPFLDVKGHINVRGNGVDAVESISLGSPAYRKATINSPALDGDTPYLAFAVTTAATSSTAAEVMRILSSGNVGIGTVSPAARLHVTGNVASINVAAFSTSDFVSASVGTALFIGQGATTGNTYSTINSLYAGAAAWGNLVLQEGGGNVGIGTTGPGTKLQIVGTNSVPIVANAGLSGYFALTHSAAGDYGMFAGVSDTGNGWIQQVRTDAATYYNLLLQPSGGNVGIGTTSPYAQLSVHANNGGTNTTLFAIASSTASATTTLFSVSNTGTVNSGAIVATGNISAYNASFLAGINGMSDASAYGFNGNSAAGMGLPSQGQLTLWSGGAGTIVFNTTSGYSYSSANDRMIVTSTGNVGIGTTSPDMLLSVGSATPVGRVAHFENSTGSCYINPTTTALECTSDVRRKSNVNAISTTTALAGIEALSPVFYNWNSEVAGTPEHAGFIAQQVQPIFPDLVSAAPDGFLTMNYAGLTPYLTAALQGLAAKIEPLAAVLSIEPGVDSQCVTGDTRLRRRRRRVDGSFEFDEVDIKDIVAGDEIASLDDHTGRVVYSRVNALIDMGEQEVYELVTRSGRRIRTTSNHPFLARMAPEKV